MLSCCLAESFDSSRENLRVVSGKAILDASYNRHCQKARGCVLQAEWSILHWCEIRANEKYI